MCGLLCIASFTWHSVFKVWPWCSMYQCVIPSHSWMRFHCMERLHFVYPFIYWWELGCPTYTLHCFSSIVPYCLPPQSSLFQLVVLTLTQLFRPQIQQSSLIPLFLLGPPYPWHPNHEQVLLYHTDCANMPHISHLPQLPPSPNYCFSSTTEGLFASFLPPPIHSPTAIKINLS